MLEGGDSSSKRRRRKHRIHGHAQFRFKTAGQFLCAGLEDVHVARHRACIGEQCATLIRQDRQAGGAILVDNNPTSSPYKILAVGPPNAMRDVFDNSPGLQRLRLLELSYGVGVTVNVSDGLSLPAGSIRDVKFAKQIGP